MIKLITTALTAALLAGCAATKTEPFKRPDITSVAPMKQNVGILTIIAPTKPVNITSNANVYYDYFMDCKEDRCKIGKMKYGQYITVYPPYGFHSIFVRPSKEGLANSILLSGEDEIYEQRINIQRNKRHYISHEWVNSFAARYFTLFVLYPSILRDIGEHDGTELLYMLLEKHETVGGRLNDYGVNGIVYSK